MNLQFQSTLKDLIAKLSWFRSVSLGFVSFRFVSLNIISRKQGVIKSKFDDALFFWVHDGVLPGIMCCHVDDFCWDGTNAFVERIIFKLKAEFQIGMGKAIRMGKRWTPNVNPEVGKTWTPIEQSNVNSLFRREFKIYGQINEQGKGDQLSFVSLSRQIEGAIEKGYTDKEAVEAVIKAMKPGMQLRSYVETVRDLTLPRLRQILISHYKEKSGTQLYQEQATIF